jgi:hypothetical protein
MTHRFEVTCFTCNGPIDFLHGDPTQPVCAGCHKDGDRCKCPVGPERRGLWPSGGDTPQAAVRPTHVWNGVHGHDCRDCGDSMWKCDIYAHGGLPTDRGFIVRTQAEIQIGASRWTQEALDGAMQSPLLRWLRGSRTRRLFAAALGDRIPDSWPDPTAHLPYERGTNETYLRMATQVIDYIANEVADEPWKGMISAWREEAKVALDAGTHQPAVDDFGNQYLARRDLNGTCHNCGQPMIERTIGREAVAWCESCGFAHKAGWLDCIETASDSDSEHYRE